MTPINYNFPNLYEGDTFHGISVTARQSEQSQFSVATIHRTGNIATAVTSVAHGLATSNLVKLTGANESDYNNAFSITVIDGTSFSFAVVNDPASPATGEIKGQKLIPIDLTHVGIKMDIRQSETSKSYLKRFTDESGITKTDAINGVFKIDAFIVDFPATNYVYDLQFSYNSGVVATYLKGKILVTNEVTSNA